MISNLATSVSQNQLGAKTIRPIGACSLRGIAFRGDTLLAVDSTNGYLLQVEPSGNDTKVLNPRRWSDFVGATGLAISSDTLWFAAEDSIYFCALDSEDWKPQTFVRLSYPVDGVAVWKSTVYVTCQRTGEILIFSRETGSQITRFYAPGIGRENITVRDEELWVSDATEQTVYCLDRATGQVNFSVLTPFESPTALAFYTNPVTAEDTLYVAYADSEPYIRDNPNAEPNYELQYRDRTFVHPLYFHYDAGDRHALSNGYLVEMSYVEELSPLDPVELKDVEWRIALPAQTARQTIRKIEPIGIPFSEEIQDGQRVAVFKFDTLSSEERFIFGWKATLEVWSIKYQLSPRECENLPQFPPNFERYLIDDDDLAMESEIICRAAQESVARETNLLRKMYSIRNYVYDRLSYGIKPHIDTPDIVLKRGVGSCGEYLGVLLALARLNGIACRTVGRYKCPPYPLNKKVPLQPDFNHVWMEFYVPGVGWLPMESNPDDVAEGGPYPGRFFMGLAWYHAEMAKGVPFETLTSEGTPVSKERVSIGELAINHVQFTILEELMPGRDNDSVNS